MSASNAVCPTCLPLAPATARREAPLGWAAVVAAWQRWRLQAAQRRVARLAASLSPGLRRDLGLHEMSLEASAWHAHAQPYGHAQPHAPALAEYERMRW
jgi:hypothetical protein